MFLAISVGPQFGHWAFTALFWITCLVGVIWLKRHIDINRGRREPVLGPDQPGPAESDLPKLTVLVAAKDEEANIGRCVSGLLAQDYPNLQVIVINDRSHDRTGAIIDEFAARDTRMRAVHVTELRDGWFGKNNAMREGTERANGEWLCYSDADCAYDSPRLLTAAMRFALTEKVDFLSVLPRLEAGEFWERVVQPAAGAVMMFWFPPQKVNDPKASAAYANGAFMLLSRDSYEKLGGHEPVKATLNEDMHLARRCKQIGLRLRVIRGGDMYRVRMYVGLPQIWRGWSRIFYGCFGTFPRLLASVMMLAVFSVAPYFTLVLAPLFAGAAWPWLSGAAAFAILSQQTVLWRLYAVTGNGSPWAMSYALGSAVCMGMAINAMRRLGATTTTWRGTTYRGGGEVAPGSSTVAG